LTIGSSIGKSDLSFFGFLSLVFFKSSESSAFASCEYGLSYENRPAAVRYYQILPKGKEILEKILGILKK
jgi:hypothetical protein